MNQKFRGRTKSGDDDRRRQVSFRDLTLVIEEFAFQLIAQWELVA